LSARRLPPVGGSQPSAKSSLSVANSVEPDCRKQWYLVRGRAKPEREKLKAESEAKRLADT